MDLVDFLSFKESSLAKVLRDEFGFKEKEFKTDVVLINPFTTHPDAEFYNYSQSYGVSDDSNSQQVQIASNHDMELDFSFLDTADEFVGAVVAEEAEVSEAEKSISEDIESQNSLLDISQNYIDFSYDADESACSAGEAAAASKDVIDYPFFGESSSDSDFDFEESDGYVRLSFKKSAKKSKRNLTKKKLSFTDSDADSPKYSKIIGRDIATSEHTTVIKLTEEKLNSATQYFNIDIADIKKYYTNKGECLLCGNIYFSSATARRHIKLSHMKLREYKCPQCFLCFQEHKGVKEHLRKFHPEYQIVDLRTVKKEFRKSIVGGILQDRIDPDIFEDKKVIRVDENVNKQKQKKIKRETVLLECQHCDEKFRNVTAIRAHISKAHKNPQTPTEGGSGKKRRDRFKKTASNSKEFSPVDNNNNNSSRFGNVGSGIKIKQEVEDEATENSTSRELKMRKKEQKIQKLDAQRNLLQTLISELNEDENYSQILARKGGARIKEEPISHEEDFESNTDGFISLQTVSCASVDDDMFSFRKVEESAKNEFLMDCPKCNARLWKIPDFNSHMVDHWKEDKRCAVCRKDQGHKSGLLVHLRIHSGEKPFACRKCGSGFSQLANVNSHERRCSVSETAKTATTPKTKTPPKTTKTKSSKSSAKKSGKVSSSGNDEVLSKSKLKTSRCGAMKTTKSRRAAKHSEEKMHQAAKRKRGRPPKRK